MSHTSGTNGSGNGDGASRDDDRHVMATTGRTARQQTFGPGGGVGVPTERSDNFGEVMRRLGQVLGKETRLFGIIVLLTVASVILSVIGPYLLGGATDIIVDGLTGGTGIDLDELHRQLWLIGAIYAGSWVFGYAQAHILAGMLQRSMFRLRESVEAKIHRLPLSYLDRQARGDLLSRVTNDIDNLDQSLRQTMSQILVSLLTVIGVIVMMFVVSPVLAVVALITVPLSVWVMKVVAGKARPKFMEQWRHTGSLNAQAEEVFTGHAIVKSFGRQRDVEQRFNDENDNLYQASYQAQFMASLVQPVMVFLGNIQFILIAVVGGLRISSGAMTVGEMQALLQYARQFNQPLSHLASMVATFQSGIASLERVLELIDADELSPEPPPSENPPPTRGRVAFEDVSFSYRDDQPLIEHLDVVAEPGQTVAIVGPTGAGKTTLVNLLMRFYDLDGGRITLDGYDITQISRQELRSNVGMVLQDTWLFGGTIRENLAYGNASATDEQIQEAARAAYVDRFVHHLPDGYDTVLSDDGDTISAGERQLITIARAFLADPAILILDEATSSVDTRTEVLIQEAMSALRSERTSFVIAHRLSTIRGADIILVMNEGRIVEQGNHDELLAAGGQYAELHRAQFAGEST